MVVIMSGPIKPLTEIERAVAQAALAIDGGGHSLVTRTDMLTADEQYISAEKAAKILNLSIATVRCNTPGWRRQYKGMVCYYALEDVLATAEKRKQMRK